jgi:hypothetical protein
MEEQKKNTSSWLGVVLITVGLILAMVLLKLLIDLI